MTEKIKARKKTILDLLENDDFDLAYRSFFDYVLDSENHQLYRQTIQFHERLATSNWTESSRKEALIEFLLPIEYDKAFRNADNQILEAVAVKKRYGQHSFQLGPVDLSIRPGEIWGLVGENGNGKTTLLRILAKDLCFDSGELKTGIEGRSTDLYNERSQLIYLAQRTPKWSGTMKEHLKLTAAHYGWKGEQNESIVMMYLIRFGLWPYRNFEWKALSSGYKMRFELARTLLRKPKILLLDEPLANLDVLAQQTILEDLVSLSQSLANPLAIVLSSQQLYEVEKISNRVIFLKNGFPTHLAEAIQQTENTQVVFEMEVPLERNILQDLLKDLAIDKLSYNGGTYTVVSNQANIVEEVLSRLFRSGVTLTYFRNITHSTRRLFN